MPRHRPAPSTLRNLAIAVAGVWMLLPGAGASSLAQTFGRPGLVVKVAPVTVSPGGRAETRVTLDIQKGYRIIAPGTAGRFVQPAIRAFDASDGVFVEPVSWPEGTSWAAEKDDPEVKVYEGRLELKVVVRATEKATARSITLSGRLRYQAIKQDYFEKVTVLPVSLPVTVAAPPAPGGKPATRP